MFQGRSSSKLLHIDSSPLGSESVSRNLSAAVVDAWRRRNPLLAVTYRDLATDPIGHMTAQVLKARQPADGLMAAEQRERELTETLIGEFLAADVVVVGAPMYNFSISSQLKAWVDRIVQAGRTFRYTEAGPVGLVFGKRVILASSRGGIYATPEKASQDHQETYLKLIFGFLGITDIEIVRAEGLALGPAPRERSIKAAHAAIIELARNSA